MIWILFIVLAVIYTALPFWLQVILTFINTGMPDPIPVLDEVLMYGSIIKKILTFIDVSDRVEQFVIWWKLRFTKEKIRKILLAFLVIGVILAFISEFI